MSFATVSELTEKLAKVEAEKAQVTQKLVETETKLKEQISECSYLQHHVEKMKNALRYMDRALKGKNVDTAISSYSNRAVLAELKVVKLEKDVTKLKGKIEALKLAMTAAPGESMKNGSGAAKRRK